MKRFILIITIVGIAFSLTGANSNADAETEKKFCKGYSVIEVDKGIDCNGDTIKLVKVNGFFERAI